MVGLNMRMDTTIKRKKKVTEVNHATLLGVGVGLIALATVLFGISLWEAFGSAAKFRVIRVPGFHEMTLDRAGLYVGVYQHVGQGAIPVRELTKLDVRVMSKDTYQEVPVLMNSAGQAVSRMGFRGLPLFNFAIQRPGDYTLSAVYQEGMTGPNVPVLVFHQSVTDVKGTLIAGVLFFLFFTTLGVWVLVKARHWAAPADGTPAKKL